MLSLNHTIMYAGIQVSIMKFGVKTYDASVQCDLRRPLLADASVQCQLYPFTSSAPTREVDKSDISETET